MIKDGGFYFLPPGPLFRQQEGDKLEGMTLLNMGVIQKLHHLCHTATLTVYGKLKNSSMGWP